MTTPYTQRVEVGSYYTDGEAVWEVFEVCDLGSVDLVNIANERERAMGIDAFRREMWLVLPARKPIPTEGGSNDDPR